jgi:CRP-like cAMP-binding protein
MAHARESARTNASSSTNRILKGLSTAEFERLQPSLSRVQLVARDPLWEPNRPIEAVYFPLTCVTSVMAMDEQGGEVEVGTVGNEGLVGLPVFLGAVSSPGRAFTQIAGEAEQMPVDEFQRATRDGALRHLINLYTQGFVTQVSQSVACNRLHNPQQRLARWLLSCRDRVGEDVFPLKQEFMAQMLGVRRATVSDAASALQDAGLIAYSRGTIHIRDRRALEDEACDCYKIVRNEFDRLLGRPFG